MSDADELHTAAAKMRTFPGPAATPLAHLLDVLANTLDDEGDLFREEALAVARAINGGQR